MPLDDFEKLFSDADERDARIPVVAAGGADETVLSALRTAYGRGWITPIVTGDEPEICRVADDCNVALDGFRILDTKEPASVAVAEVRAGRASVLMKGQIATPTLMQAVLDRATGLRTGRCICQIVLMEITTQARRILLADTGICIQPTLDEKADVLRQTVDVGHALGADVVRVALLAATERATDAMPETIEAAELQRRSELGEFPGCVAQGPISFDLAYAADAGDKKRIEGQVVGAADVLLFPNLLSANLTVKAIMYTAQCRFGGILSGAACPIVFMSRADTAATRLRSIAFALRVQKCAIDR